MASLTIAFEIDTAMGLLYKAYTDKWAEGVEHLVVDALFKKYQPKDRISSVEHRCMLNSVSMKYSEDPAVLFEQLSGIKNKFASSTIKINEEDFIAVVMEAATSEYAATLTSKQRLQGNELTLSHLNIAMTQYW